ncbi:hypothetical protein CAP36_08665 [Chitinophagaceae bacterium IBVUCB2]|nr:hypothetical protein CAP36_08665 [Chitinophagaceae bacterium IBVUCB2]
MTRSYYSNSISDFITDNETKILGELSLRHGFALESLQKNAWVRQIQILKKSLEPFRDGQIYFEFAIPRMGKRVDNILIINDLIFVLEFKIGESQYPKYATEQVVDYCLDLKNFHQGSHYEKLIPILISTNALAIENIIEIDDNLFEPIYSNQENLSSTISLLVNQFSSKKINTIDWETSIYKPTPTIIEAAQALYKGHDVKEISRHDAGAINLSRTTSCINKIIDSSKENKRKSICFLTGVPGAGKTLAGLNIANERLKADKDEHAVFLSGNGPLVDVLREALTRDEVLSAKERGQIITKKNVATKTHAFIQNIHHFRDDNLIIDSAPTEKVIVYDEAQRAWAKEQVSSFMKRKKGIEDFNMSEPEYLIGLMDRHDDWCTIVCLIGGGQEINTGEAGVSEWLKALKNTNSNWDAYYSNLFLTDESYLSDQTLRKWISDSGKMELHLHLSVCVRSFRSEKISELMHNILESKTQVVKDLFLEVRNEFPIYLTRSLATAKNWLREKAKGSERFGIIASSGGKRLRPCGIDVNNQLDAPNWFLNNSDDVRSSNHLEDVATEFDIQGLEIDWVCLAWDINFYNKEGKWFYQSFKGTKWQRVKQLDDLAFLKNTYRVLMTRARQGLIIYLPHGDDLDITRPKELYDATFKYFISCGFTEI